MIVPLLMLCCQPAGRVYAQDVMDTGGKTAMDITDDMMVDMGISTSRSSGDDSDEAILIGLFVAVLAVLVILGIRSDFNLFGQKSPTSLELKTPYVEYGSLTEEERICVDPVAQWLRYEEKRTSVMPCDLRLTYAF